jgi:hypothetical protein
VINPGKVRGQRTRDLNPYVSEGDTPVRYMSVITGELILEDLR